MMEVMIMMMKMMIYESNDYCQYSYYNDERVDNLDLDGNRGDSEFSNDDHIQ